MLEGWNGIEILRTIAELLKAGCKVIGFALLFIVLAYALKELVKSLMEYDREE